MGTFRATFEVAARSEGPWESVEALVDSGATYTLLPGSLLERMGVRRTRTRTFVLADGTVHDLDMGRIWVRLEGDEESSPVVFGSDDAEPLLGAVTLEELTLGIDPVSRKLVRVSGYMVGIRLQGTP